MTHRMILMGSDPIALPGFRAIQNGECGVVDIIAVYTQPDRARGRGKKVVPNEIKLWAQGCGIPVRQPERMGKEERLAIEADSADSILVMAYGHILSQRLIDTPKFGIWNLHASLLPRYRGASPIQCSVANGESEAGVSLMKMVRQMDAGPVLDIERVGIEEADTAIDVEAKLSSVCIPLLRRNLSVIHSGEARPQAQDESKASYVRKLGKGDGALDFRVPAAVLARRVNGLYPWPGTRFEHAGTVIKVGLALAVETGLQAAAGEVLGVDEEGLRVACGSGAVLFKSLQRPGGKMLEAAAFSRGFEIPAGSVLKSAEMPELVGAEPFRA